MSRILLTKSAAPATPATNKAILFIDTNDRKLKMIDDNGIISTLNNDGLQDRNIITNGGFNVQQRMAVASTAIAGVSTTTRAGQVADRWAVTTSVASNLNWQQVDTGSAPETNLASRYYGSIISASAGKKVMLSQFIQSTEMDHMRGMKVRLSIKTNQKVGNAQSLKLGLLQLTAAGTIDVCPQFLSGAWSTSGGTDPAWGTNLAAITPDASPTAENAIITGSYAVITTQQTIWLKSSAVFTVPTNAKNLVAVIFSDATGGSTDNISFAEFQLTQGPDMVEYKEPPVAETLLRCQRFFCKSFPLAVAPAASVSIATGGHGEASTLLKSGSGTALACIIPIKFPVEMWKTPAVTYYTPITTGALVYRHGGATPAAQGATATIASSLTAKGVIVGATGEATINGVVGDLVSIHYSAEAEFIT